MTLRAIDAHRDWLFFPSGAPAARTDDYDAVAFPAGFDLPTQVMAIHSDRPPADLVTEVGEVVRGWGRPDVAWIVTDQTRPASMEDHLRHIGAELVQTADWLFFDLGRAIPEVSAPCEVRFVESDADVDAFDQVQQAGWGHPPADDATRATWLEHRETMDNHPIVVMTNGEPVSAAGVRLVGGVARMWGGVTVPDARGRGAYRAGVIARLQFARERGAELAIAAGRTETSGPILRRLGFVAVGQQRSYLQRL